MEVKFVQLSLPFRHPDPIVTQNLEYMHACLLECVHTSALYTGVNPGEMGGCIPPPPTFLGGGMACTNIPPLFGDKITINLTFIVKKLTFLM